MLKKILLLSVFAAVLVSCADDASMCPDERHPHLIDLGLPSGTQWACCNIGSYAPESSGDFFAWGETESKTYFHPDNFNGPYYENEISGTSYDVARMKWGGEWQMPTSKQIMELMAICNKEFVKYKGVHGAKFTGTNGNSIFIPAAYSVDAENDNRGAVWSSERADSDDDEGMIKYAFDLFFSEKAITQDADMLEHGHNVRAVVAQ